MLENLSIKSLIERVLDSNNLSGAQQAAEEIKRRIKEGDGIEGGDIELLCKTFEEGEIYELLKSEILNFNFVPRLEASKYFEFIRESVFEELESSSLNDSYLFVSYTEGTAFEKRAKEVFERNKESLHKKQFPELISMIEFQPHEELKELLKNAIQNMLDERLVHFQLISAAKKTLEKKGIDWKFAYYQAAMCCVSKILIEHLDNEEVSELLLIAYESRIVEFDLEVIMKLTEHENNRVKKIAKKYLIKKGRKQIKKISNKKSNKKS